MNSWNALLTVGQNRVRASDAGHNATLPPGESTQICYQAQADRPFGPSGFVLNGVACTT